MTDEEKANEIARDMLPYNNAEYHACYNSAMKAMQWKEEQHKQEKQQWIDEACEKYCNCCGSAYIACRRYNYDKLHCERYLKFKKAMEE